MAFRYNELTAGQQERLALLLEEMGESIQIIGKIQRFGYESRRDPGDVETNRDLLATELGHLLYAIDLLCFGGKPDVSAADIVTSKTKKSETVRKYLHHQKNRLPMY